MRGSKQLALMFLLGAVLVGGVLGFTADRFYLKDQVCAEQLTPAQARQRFHTELGLTAAQSAAVDSVMDDRHQQIATLMKPVRPQIEAVKDSTRAQLMRILTPDQRVKFEEMRQEMRRRKSLEEKK